LEFNITVKLDNAEVANHKITMSRNSMTPNIFFKDGGITLKQGKNYDVHVSCILDRTDGRFRHEDGKGSTIRTS
jgi:hypothetical protein